MKGHSFNERGARRIVDTVRWGERMRQGSSTNHIVTYKPQSEQIYVKLTARDEDEAGYWKAEEVVFEEGVWQLKTNGRVWDGEDYPYIRHVRWEDAILNSIVEAFQISDVTNEEKPYIWVFMGEITNPEAFIFYADRMGGVAQTVEGDVWKMPKGGTVYTNHGQIDVDAQDFELGPNQTAYCLIQLINFLGEWQIASAEITTEGGEYWEESSGYLNVRVKIASTVEEGRICRLTQHHAGDIRFELFQDVSVSSGNPWIGVVNNNNNYVVSHLLPPDKHQDEFIAITGLCDDMPTSNFEAWIEWFVNARVHLRYDQLGHIYQRENCYGEIDDYTDEDDDDNENLINLNGNLSAPLVSAQLQPWALTGGDGFTPTYTVLNGVKNYTDYVGVEDVMLFAVNSLNQIIKIDDQIIGFEPAFDVNYVTKASNIGGTSGLQSPHMYLDVRNFRFNDTITVKAGIVGKGLGAQVVLNTATCTTTITATTSIRDYQDPNVSAQDYQITSSNVNVGTAGYKYLVNFTYADGEFVAYRFGADAAFLEGSSIWNISLAGSTNSEPIQFDLRDSVEHGDVIRMTAKLIYPHNNGVNADANCSAVANLYVAGVDECYTDAAGNHLSTDDECYSEPQGFEHATMYVTTSGLNEWEDLEPLIAPSEFTDSGLQQRAQMGYEKDDDLTEARFIYSRFPAGTTSINMRYRWYKRSIADSQTLKLLASTAPPEVGGDVLSMVDTGISITPTDQDLSTDRFLNISGAIGSVDNSKTFFLAWVPSQYYDGDSPSSWPDCASDGGEVWVSPFEYTIS